MHKDGCQPGLPEAEEQDNGIGGVGSDEGDTAFACQALILDLTLTVENPGGTDLAGHTPGLGYEKRRIRRNRAYGRNTVCVKIIQGREPPEMRV